MTELITSPANPFIKRARSLADRRRRRADGAFLAEGGQVVWRAMDSGWPIRTLIYAPELLSNPRALLMVEQAPARGIRVVAVNAAVFGTLSDRDGPSGIAAIVAMPSPGLAELAVGEQSVLVVLEQVGNPGNLGTIVRTADALGGVGVVLLGACADPFAPQAVKASMGSVFALPVVSAGHDEFLAWARSAGLHLLATSGAAAHVLAPVDGPVAVLLGSEGAGLSEGLLGAADQIVRIPMTGTAESLNLAVAAGIVLYELTGGR